MQLPSIDRDLTPRSAAGTASPVVNRVTPVAPAEPSPSVINMVNPALKTLEGVPVYASVVDPVRTAPEVATAPKDWTIRRPVQEKVEDPPPKPISQILMDHLRVVWTASASAIHQEQTKNQLEQPLPVNPSLAPGNLAKEVLTYEPAKIKKNEKL